MTLADQMATDFTSAMLNTGEFAQAVTYHPDGDSDKTINAVWQEDPEESRGGLGEVRDHRDRRFEVREGTLWIAQDATLGIAAPTDEDLVTVDSVKYSVLGTPRKEGGVWVLRLRRADRQEDVATGLSEGRV